MREKMSGGISGGEGKEREVNRMTKTEKKQLINAQLMQDKDFFG